MNDKRIGGDGMGRTRARTPGKLTAEIKVRIDDDTRDELERLAFEAGMDLAQFLRELVMIRVYGIDHIARLQERRLSLVAGIGDEEG